MSLKFTKSIDLLTKLKKKRDLVELSVGQTIPLSLGFQKFDLLPLNIAKMICVMKIMKKDIMCDQKTKIH